MEKRTFEWEGRRIWLYGAEAPTILFLQPVDAHDAELLDREIEAMRGGTKPFALAAFQVEDWDRDLSPWEAPPVFGKIPFAGKAEDTLAFVTGGLLPKLRDFLALDAMELCIGGYSLAGLFALWAATRTDLFSGVAAASPSVWYPGWMDYVNTHLIQAKNVYLSLGDREERTKNPVMATVGDCIRALNDQLQTDHRCTLEWNPGNHFQNSELRTAKAFRWIAARD
ncbi:MAG: esterase [Oscillospiraceae bacterium]|nr:esterase [Oscillospiraceae bacterium]